MRRLPTPFVIAALVLSPAFAGAGPTKVVQNPSYDPRPEPLVIDYAAGTVGGVRTPLVDPGYGDTVQFSDLDQFVGVRSPQPPPEPSEEPRALSNGLTQVGTMVVPDEMLDGAAMVGNADAAERSVDGGVNPLDVPADDCAFPGDVPPGVYEGDHLPGGEVPRLHTIYMNFVGGVLESMGENSAENYSGIARSGHMYPVFSYGEATAVAVAQAVAVDFERYAVRVVYDPRPRKIIPYTMAMVGGRSSDTTAGDSCGVAPLDCEDFGQRNVNYTFECGASAIGLANTASQEIGHTMGLSHVSDCDAVMGAGYTSSCASDKGFGTTCERLITAADQSPACTGINLCHCGDRNLQNDDLTLLFTYAPSSTVDNTDPIIDILEPPDGKEYASDEDVIIKLDVWDDFGGYGWKILIEDVATSELLVDQVDYDRATEFRLKGFPEGTYKLTAEIEDQADHIVTTSIMFTVGPTTGTTGGTDSATDGDGTDSADGGADASAGDGTAGDGTDAGADATASGDDDGGNGEKDGCSCATTPGRSAATFLLLGLFAVRRRRR